jgi:UMF1 family MFS transporter
VTDKGSSWVGPLLVGAISQATGSIRHSFIMLFGFFAIPIFIFWTIDVKKGKQQAKQFEKKNKL